MRAVQLLIIGAGPAGYTAAIYAARASLQPLLLTGLQAGGQLTITTDVENYPGFADVIQGPWLMQEMQSQAEKVGTEIVYDMVVGVDFGVRPFICDTDSGLRLCADSVIIATGAEARWLGLPSEEKFKGFGVSACATCDGFFFRDKVVAVVGGGNTAVEEALYLTRHARKVYLVHRRGELRAERILQDRLFGHASIEFIGEHRLLEVIGEDTPLQVTGVDLQNTVDGTVRRLDVDGVFIAIGHVPATAIFKGQLAMDADGYLITETGKSATAIAGIYAAGDVCDKIYRQAVTAAGMGCMAALEAEKFLSGMSD